MQTISMQTRSMQLRAPRASTRAAVPVAALGRRSAVLARAAVRPLGALRLGLGDSGWGPLNSRIAPRPTLRTRPRCLPTPPRAPAGP
jgi:hypothetical protein